MSHIGHPQDFAPSQTSQSNSLKQAYARNNKAQARQRTFVARLSGPRWWSLTRRTLEISGSKASDGWKYSIRTYNIVPWDSLVMEFARKGKVSEIRSLITEGKASMYDCNSNGDTPFLVCIISFWRASSNYRASLLTHIRWLPYTIKLRWLNF